MCNRGDTMHTLSKNIILKLTLGTLIMVILVMSGCVTQSPPPRQQRAPAEAFAGTHLANSAPLVLMSTEQATALALQVAEGKVTEIEQKQENNTLVYIVEVEESPTSETEVTIDAATGAILKVEREDELGKKELELIRPNISAEQAKGLALQQVKGEVTDVEASKINGRYVYEVEVQTNGEETDVLIDMLTGAILGVERETQDENDDEDDASAPEFEEPKQKRKAGSTTHSDQLERKDGSPVTEEQAKQIALDHVSGGRVTDFEDKGDTYEVEIRKGSDEIDVLVSKETGEVMGVERD